VQKAKVKKDYYKQISKGDPDLETPDYVKEIFGERTIDEEGNIVNYKSSSKRKRDDEDDKVHDLDEEPSSSEDDGSDNDEMSPGKAKNVRTESAKPNPFRKDIEKQALSKEAAEKEREEMRKEKEKQQKGRAKYYKQRKEVRGKMMARNARGQPKMGSQINLLLDKIQHEVAKDNRREKKRVKRMEKREIEKQQQQQGTEDAE